MSGAVTSLPSWARVGAKVVCIDASSSHQMDGLAEGTTYTVRSISLPEPWETGAVGVRLNEIKRHRAHYAAPEHVGPYDIPFNIARFRPLVDDQAQERDVALFRKHLTQKIPESVE